MSDGITSHDLVQIVLCGVIFGSFTFLGIGLILDALLRCVVITQEECYSRSFYGVKKSFDYTDISYCLMIIKNHHIQYRLYRSNHQKLASFEDNMIGSEDLILSLIHIFMYCFHIDIKSKFRKSNSSIYSFIISCF